MRVKLRRGLFWSDGVEFTSADVKATVDIQIKSGAMRFSAVLANNVASVEAPDAETPRGVNIFGRGFGNHNQDIRMRLHLDRPGIAAA